MRLKIDYSIPNLIRSSAGNNFVEFRCFYPAKNKVERFRVYKGLAKLPEEILLEKAGKLISFYTKKLEAGWRPWNDEAVVYRDQIEYTNVVKSFGNVKNDTNHIRRYLSEFLNFKKSDVAPKTFQDYTSKARLFCMWLEKNGHITKSISEIDNEIIIAYFTYLIQVKKLDRETIKKYRQVLSNIFQFFLSKKLIKEVPFNNLPKASFILRFY